MEKKNIFKKIASSPKIETLKNTFSTIKSKVLDLGKPDEKSLLYKEVVKREKEEAKIAKQEAKEAKKQIIAKKAEAKNIAAKNDASKKTINKKNDTKKTSTKSSDTNKKETTTTKTEIKKSTNSTSKVASKSTKNTKKDPVKKTSSSPKKTASKKPISKSTEKKKSVTKTKSTSKATSTPSKKDAKIALYTKDITKHYGEVDKDLLTLIVKNLGPSIYRKDAELVSCSEPKELDTVRRNFLVKKLGLEASNAVLDAAIQDVCEELKGVRQKYRATFYYSLTKKFKKESALS